MDPRLLIGKRLDDPEVPTPAVVLDRAAVKRNCERMLQATKALGLGWRAHVKTHKTTELTRLMVGDSEPFAAEAAGPARIVVSTLLEAQRVLPLMLEYRSQGRPVNVLYGFPLYASAVPQLAAIGRALGPGGVSVIADHPDQVAVARQLADAISGDAADVGVFVKIDMGTSRAGVVPGSAACAALVRRLLAEHHAEASGIRFHGLYCHAGHSYDARQPWASMAHLVAEFAALGAAAKEVSDAAAALSLAVPPLTLSVGASPTAATLQHPDLGGGGGASEATDEQDRARAAELRAMLDALRRDGNVQLEAHAGVYPVRDLQQLATHSWAGAGAAGELDDLALRVLADVASVYPGRGRDGRTDEVLINAGCLALARDTVKKTESCAQDRASSPVYADAYGIVAPWPAVASDRRFVVPGAEFPLLPAPDVGGGGGGWWQVARISQEHGILAWAGAADAAVTPPIGQRLLIWPNHACITAAMYGYFLVVDSSTADATEVVDVWERWTGW